MKTDTNKHKELDSLRNNMALSGLWTSSGNFESKLREFAIRYESAKEWDDPSVDNAAEMQAIVDDFIAATSRLIMEEVRAGRVDELNDLLLYMPEYSDAEEIVEGRIAKLTKEAI